MLVARTPEELTPAFGGVLIPTMGALHAGHLALIREAAAWRRGRSPTPPIVLSVFVNPTQFDEADDFARYPHDLERDVALAERAGADAVFAPPIECVYPAGEDIPTGPIPACAVGKGLEDEFRPGHFEGVCQVVRRFFGLSRCAAAVFGEKDWQQLQTARAMSRDEGLGVEVIAGATVREEDGMALSSRNVHLSPDERTRARAISRGLCAAGAEPTIADAGRALREAMADAGIDVNYATIRDARTLAPLDPGLRPADLGAPARALAAGRLGLVRLLDNAPWPG